MQRSSIIVSLLALLIASCQPPAPTLEDFDRDVIGSSFQRQQSRNGTETMRISFTPNGFELWVQLSRDQLVVEEWLVQATSYQVIDNQHELVVDTTDFTFTEIVANPDNPIAPTRVRFAIQEISNYGIELTFDERDEITDRISLNAVTYVSLARQAE